MTVKTITLAVVLGIRDEEALRDSTYDRCLDKGMSVEEAEEFTVSAIKGLDECVAMLIKDRVPGASVDHVEMLDIQQPPARPAHWSKEQVAQFLTVAFRHCEIKGSVTADEINQGLRYMAEMGMPAFVVEK